MPIYSAPYSLSLFQFVLFFSIIHIILFSSFLSVSLFISSQPLTLATTFSSLAVGSDHVPTTNKPLQGSFGTGLRPPPLSGLGAKTVFIPTQTNQGGKQTRVWFNRTEKHRCENTLKPCILPVISHNSSKISLFKKLGMLTQVKLLKVDMDSQLFMQHVCKQFCNQLKESAIHLIATVNGYGTSIYSSLTFSKMTQNVA